MPFWQALEMAHSQGMRLVEINGQATPVVCRIMDYGKFVFQQNKNKKSQKKAPKLKEIKLRPVTDEGDFQVKLRNLIGFLEKGDKVKVTLKFRGREIAHQELADNLFAQILEATAALAHVDSPPKLEGKQMILLLSPKTGQTTQTAVKAANPGSTQAAQDAVSDEDDLIDEDDLDFDEDDTEE